MAMDVTKDTLNDPARAYRRTTSQTRRGPRVRRKRLAVAVSALLAGGVAPDGAAQSFPPVVELGGLPVGEGFRLDGAAAGDNSGGSVSAAGDINGDGIDDLIVGAPNADHNGNASGSSYVVFGNNDVVFADGFESD